MHNILKYISIANINNCFNLLYNKNTDNSKLENSLKIKDLSIQ